MRRLRNKFGSFEKCSYFCSVKPILEITMSNEQQTNTPNPTWVIILKAVAYIIGLVLAGVGTTASAQMIGLI